VQPRSFDKGGANCDARILNVFEGAAEIQANIVIKGLLAGG